MTFIKCFTTFLLILFSSIATAASDDKLPWTGFYLGLNGGAVNHTMNITDVQATSFFATIEQVSNPGFTGGFQVGYRRQLELASISAIHGFEFSANFSETSFSEQYGSPYALYQLDAQNTLKNLCLLQFVGGIAANKTYLFFAAGLSWSNITGSMTNLDSVPFFNSFNMNKKAFGTAWGGGLEYALNAAFSIRFKVDVITPNSYSTHTDTNDTFQISNDIVQTVLGVNYRIG